MDRRDLLKHGSLIGVGAMAGCGPRQVDPIAGLLPTADASVRELMMLALDTARSGGASYADVRASRIIGRVGPAAAFVIALLIFATQMAGSPWWLARFQFGPTEWLWRSLTYRQLQPMRIIQTMPATTTVGA